MRRILFPVLLALAAIMAGLSGCDNDDFLTRSKQALWADRAAWMDIQDLAAELRQQGRIDDARWSQFEALDEKYRATHNTAVLALDEFERLKDESSKTIVISLLSDVGDILNQAREMMEAWKKETP